MFASLCLLLPLVTTRFDADGVPLPPGVTARYGSLRYGPPKGTYRVRFLPGEKTAVSLGENGLTVWNLETGLPVRQVIEPEWVCKDILLSKDGRKLFAVGVATTGYAEKPSEPTEGVPGKVERTPLQRVELWTYDTATFRRIATNALTDTRSDFFWFKSNGTLLIPDDSTKKKVTIVRIEPALTIQPLAIDFQMPGFFYPGTDETSSRIAYGTGKDILVYDTVADKELARYPSDAFYVAMSKDGKTVFGAGREPNTNGSNPLELFALDVGTLKRNWFQSLGNNVSFAYIYPNDPIADVVPVMGEGVANQDITYRKAGTGEPIPLQPGETLLWRQARAFAGLSADGKRLISGVNGGLSVWDVATRQQVLPKKNTFTISESSQLQYQDGGTILEVGPSDHNSMCGLKAWEVTTGREVLSIPPHRLIDDGGTTVIRRDFNNQLFQTHLTARDRSFRVAVVPEHTDPTKPAKGIPVISDPVTGREIRRLVGGPSIGSELQLTRNGRYLICHEMSSKTWRWDLSRPERPPTDMGTFTVGGNGGHSIPRYVTVSPNQTLAAVMLRAETSHPNGEPIHYEVGVYRLDTAEKLRHLKGQGMLLQKSWSASGRYLGLTTNIDFSLFDLETDQRICQVKDAYGCSIRDDGRMLGNVGDKELVFHDTLTGQVRHTIPLWGGVTSVAFTPDRRSVACVAHDNTVHVRPIFPLSKTVPITRAEMDAAFPDLASTDAKKAFLAVRLFASDETLSVPYLREKMPPSKLPADVAATIAALDSPQFAERKAAYKRLIALGSVASGPLKRELNKTESVESRTRIEEILATHGTTAPADLLAHRASEVLDILDTPTARRLRAEWAEGELSILTATAKAKPRAAPFASQGMENRKP